MTQDKKKKILPLLGILFLAGIIFLALSEYHSNKGEGDSPAFDEAAYTRALEARLGSMISQMQGVDNVQVMITLESTGKVLVNGKSNAESQALQVLSGTQGVLSQDAYLVKVCAPEIRGVSVVCSGGADPKTRAKILDLVAGTLNLNQNKIYVTE